MRRKWGLLPFCLKFKCPPAIDWKADGDECMDEDYVIIRLPNGHLLRTDENIFPNHFSSLTGCVISAGGGSGEVGGVGPG